ncbi:hypothetical protein KEM52_000649 [Ascosphaera acerosa]|nr:hypothetical protein KEM52_000649 [Ascosphaera acerosa]
MPIVFNDDNMAATSPQGSVRMTNEYSIPVLGYGVYQTPPNITKECVAQALKAGYRHIDCAQYYKNEKQVAEAIKESGIPREEVFFTTKVNPEITGYDFVKEAIQHSCAVTRLGYLDLVLAHAPFGGFHCREGTWRALVEAQGSGLVRSIGVSNYGIDHLEELLDHQRRLGGHIEVAQYELHPWCNRDEIVSWLRKRNVVIEAYSPLVQATRFDDPLLKEVSQRLNRDPAQVLLRWSMQKGYIPLVKSKTPSRIVDNTKIFDFKLSDEDVAKLSTKEYSPVCWDPTTSGINN